MEILLLLITEAYVWNTGFYSIPGIILLLVALFLYLLFPKAGTLFQMKNYNFLLVLFTAQSVIAYKALYQSRPELGTFSIILLAVSLIITLVLYTKPKESVSKLLFILYVAIWCTVGFLMVVASPNPIIDVHELVTNGAVVLSQGKNPYTYNFRNVYNGGVMPYYSYFPGLLFLSMPTAVLFHDARYMMVVCGFVSVIILFLLLKGRKERYVLPLLILSNPVSFFMIEQSYTEFFFLPLLILTGYLYVVNKRLLSAVVMGIAVGTKQHIILLVPFLLKIIPQISKRVTYLLTLSLSVAVLIVPFLVWSWYDFLDDSILLIGRLPPRWESLNVVVLFNSMGIQYQWYMTYVPVLIIFVIILFRKFKTPSDFFYHSSLFLLAFHLFNKISFLNYYYLVSQLLCTAIIFRYHEEKAHQE